MDEKFITIASKVSPFAFEALNRISQSLGMTKYELIQMCIDTWIRYADRDHNLTPEIESAMSIFEHMQGWKDALNLADPTTRAEIVKAFYLLTDKKKKGVRCVMVSQPYFGQWHETMNLQQILEQFMCTVFPELYRKLRRVGVEMGTQSVLQTLSELINEQLNNDELAELRRPFEDNDRSDYGRKPAQQPYKRGHKMSDEQVEKQFDFKPFGYEI